MDKETYDKNKQILEASELMSGRIYVDIGFLKYISLGKILASRNIDNDIYQKIVDIVKSDVFTKRNTNDPLVVFRAIPNIKDIVNLKNINHEEVLAISPEFIGAIDHITNYISAFMSRSKLFDNRNDISITVDVSRLKKINRKILQRIAFEYANIFGIPTTIITDDLANHKNEFDVFFIDELGSFTDVYINELNDGKMIKNKLFCYRNLPLSSLPDLREDDIPLIFCGIELTMSAAIDFTFIDMPICATY